MLGKLIGGSSWDWAAFGKHPVAKDYFQLNVVSPMACAFASWVDAGFRRLSEADRRDMVCSWRFWARGQKRGTSICGLGKSSSDSIGRPYPMMIIGEGILDKWEKSWQLMFAGLRETWEIIEYETVRRLSSLEQLERQLLRIPSPRKQWKQTLRMDPQHWAAGIQEHERKIVLSEVKQKARQLELDGQLKIPLDGKNASEPLELAGAWHVALKNCNTTVPHTVFMGGRPDNNVLALYIRPLAAGDFSELWS
jgi:type VI secretion system ImpM family protein